MKRKIIPSEIPIKDLHQLIIGAVAPRPIAFVSSKNENGNINLAPYSFFNVFSSNPPIAVFSSNRRATNNSTKDTLHNVRVSEECVINVVTYDILHNMAITSIEYPSDINEFVKSGLTEEKSEIIQTPKVLESPFNMECIVKDIIELGDQGGAGHLIICEIVMITLDEKILTDEKIDPYKIDLVARMGLNYYLRAQGEAIFTLNQPVQKIGIGYDKLPDSVIKSKILSAEEVWKLAATEHLPTEEDLEYFMKILPAVINLTEDNLHEMAKVLIAKSEIKEALSLLLCGDLIINKSN